MIGVGALVRGVVAVLNLNRNLLKSNFTFNQKYHFILSHKFGGVLLKFPWQNFIFAIKQIAKFLCFEKHATPLIQETYIKDD